MEQQAIIEEMKVLPEIDIQFEKAQLSLEDLEFKNMLSAREDEMPAILTINPGAGGTESQDWAEILQRMYVRWAESKELYVTLLQETRGEEAGIKSSTMKISGEFTYGWLKRESGIHRLVRISPFDSNKRRHTSFASIWVYPEVDDKIDVDIIESDLRIDTYRASGAGGQHVNKTDSAIRITHIPTNIVVQCQDGKSQHKNKAQAMKMLRAKLYETERKEKDSARASDRKNQIGSGDRSERIRTYNYPQGRVTDHRINLTLYKLEKALEGDLDEVIDALLTEDKASRLAEIT